MSNVATILLTMAQQALAAATGALFAQRIEFRAYLDHFGVNDDTLTDRHREIMDSWAAGASTTVFPFKPGSSTHKLIRFTGMASQTGAESNNLDLGRRRARNVRNYLADHLSSTQIAGEEESIFSVGSSRPRFGFDKPGSEYGENRAVEVTLETQIAVIGATPPPDPPAPPPVPLSKEWEIVITRVTAAGDPIPWFDLFGGQVIRGKLKNSRTQEIRDFLIAAGGFSPGKSLIPIDVSVNTESSTFTPFNTHYVDFDDFDWQTVVITSASVSGGAEYGNAAIGFMDVHQVVEPAGFMIKSNAGAGAQLHFGIMMIE